MSSHTVGVGTWHSTDVHRHALDTGTEQGTCRVRGTQTSSSVSVNDTILDVPVSPGSNNNRRTRKCMWVCRSSLAILAMRSASGSNTSGCLVAAFRLCALDPSLPVAACVSVRTGGSTGRSTRWQATSLVIAAVREAEGTAAAAAAAAALGREGTAGGGSGDGGSGGVKGGVA